MRIARAPSQIGALRALEVDRRPRPQCDDVYVGSPPALLAATSPTIAVREGGARVVEPGALSGPTERGRPRDEDPVPARDLLPTSLASFAAGSPSRTPRRRAARLGAPRATSRSPIAAALPARWPVAVLDKRARPRLLRRLTRARAASTTSARCRGGRRRRHRGSIAAPPSAGDPGARPRSALTSVQASMALPASTAVEIDAALRRRHPAQDAARLGCARSGRQARALRQPDRAGRPLRRRAERRRAARRPRPRRRAGADLPHPHPLAPASGPRRLPRALPRCRRRALRARPRRPPMFFTTSSPSPRARVCEPLPRHPRDLRERSATLEPLLELHGMQLRHEVPPRRRTVWEFLPAVAGSSASRATTPWPPRRHLDVRRRSRRRYRGTRYIRGSPPAPRRSRSLR